MLSSMKCNIWKEPYRLQLYCCNSSNSVRHAADLRTWHTNYWKGHLYAELIMYKKHNCGMETYPDSKKKQVGVAQCIHIQ